NVTIYFWVGSATNERSAGVLGRFLYYPLAKAEVGCVSGAAKCGFIALACSGSCLACVECRQRNSDACLSSRFRVERHDAQWIGCVCPGERSAADPLREVGVCVSPLSP